MGWYFKRDWKTKQDVINSYANSIRCNGYDVRTSGNWVYVEKDGVPLDMILLLTAKDDIGYGYKDISVTMGPYKYNAPLWMVLKIHPVMKDKEYYRTWFDKYPNKKSVLLAEKEQSELFTEVA